MRKPIAETIQCLIAVLVTPALFWPDERRTFWLMVGGSVALAAFGIAAMWWVWWKENTVGQE